MTNLFTDLPIMGAHFIRERGERSSWWADGQQGYRRSQCPSRLLGGVNNYYPSRRECSELCRMKKIYSIAAMVAVFALSISAGVLTGCKHMESEERESAHAHNYTCPMHPEVVQDSPGNCPKCGMKLVKKD